MTDLSPLPKFRATVAGTGIPLVGGQLFTYKAGSSTIPANYLATYRANPGAANTNPVILDSYGECDLWLTDDAYKFVLQDSLGNTLWSVDNIRSSSGSISIAVGKLFANTFANLAATDAQVGQVITLKAHTSGIYGGGDFIGVSSAGLTPDGGTISESATAGVYWQRKDVRQDIIDIYMFGGNGDNSTDNSLAINTAIAYLKSIGGGKIQFGHGVHRHTLPIIIDEDNIFLVGAGGRGIHDAGTPTLPITGTVLFYTGSSTTINQVTFTSPAGASNQKKRGGGMIGIWLDGNAKAQRNLVVRSWNSGTFRDIFCQGATIDIIRVDVISGVLAESTDTQGCNFEQITALASGSVNGFSLGGKPGANASFNRFYQCVTRHFNGIGFWLQNTDNNLFIQCSAGRPSGAGDGLRFAGADGVTDGHSRSNHFIQYSSNSPIVSQGTTSGWAVPATNNSISYIDGDNNTPDPTVETGSFMFWSRDNGINVNHAFINSCYGNSQAGVAEARLLRTNESLVIQNSSSNHIRLSQGTNNWGINMNASGDLRFIRGAGTGFINFGTSDVAFSGKMGFFGAALAAKPTVTGAKGGNAALTSLLTQLATLGLITDSST